MPLLIEEWKPVVGYERLYSVTNTGRVYSHLSLKFLKPALAKGYHTVKLSMRGRQRHLSVHRLVSFAFFGDCPPGFVVNHKDAWKISNRPSNLEFTTQLENTLHAVRLGINNRGERHGRSKLSDDIVVQIRSLKGTASTSQLAKQFGVHSATVQRVLNGQLWRHIP